MEKQTMVSCLEHDIYFYGGSSTIFHIYVSLREGTLQKLGVEL